MRVGLIDVDGHSQKKKLWGANIYPNLALCKIASWHKQQGDHVEWYEPMLSGHMDRVYLSKIFNFTPDYAYPIDADEVFRGGALATTYIPCFRSISTMPSPISPSTPMSLPTCLMAFSPEAVRVAARGVWSRRRRVPFVPIGISTAWPTDAARSS